MTQLQELSVEVGHEGEVPGLGRSVARGAVVGVVLAFLGVTGVLRLVGASWAAAAGVGAMGAFWGGLGFGVMVGGVVFLSRHE